MVIAQPLDRAACNELLAPHIPTLEQCFRNAWARWVEWLAKLDGSPADISARTRANIVYDFIVAEGSNRLRGAENVRIRKVRGFLVIHLNDRIALRFKKFRNKSLKTSGIHTNQATLFNQQALEFDTKFRPLTHLVAGYLLDDLALDMNKLAVTCTMNGEHLWAPIEILGTSAAGKLEPLFAQPATPKSVVRSARKKKKAGDEE
ncbi:hypothetical protein ACGFI3_36780 [Nonomuraea wenchangensis]|uniref:hypothetical protein n=1 Tax=Nonomuraea wenchangensis TaxID=568860 RepID=UPI003715AA3E